MSEKKTFKKKELNKDDYKKDVKIVNGLKKAGGVLLGIGAIVVPLLTKGKFDIPKKK